jgi:hypothetical protein
MFFRKKEIIAQTRQKHEDLEFQLMELQTRCEAELEQAEEHFQKEQIIVTQNSKIRQVGKPRLSYFYDRMFVHRILFVILIINKMLFSIK